MISTEKVKSVKKKANVRAVKEKNEETQSISPKYLDFISPSLIAEQLGQLTDESKTAELNNFVWNTVFSWGLVPTRGKWGGEISKDSALYKASLPFIRQIISSFLYPDLIIMKKPCNGRGDAVTVAISEGFPAHVCRSEFNSWINKELGDLGFRPLLGNMGALGFELKEEDGGSFPLNNPIVIELSNYFFSSLNLGEAPESLAGDSAKFVSKRNYFNIGKFV